MCGIVAYVGDKPADINAIKILGIYNTSRGTDSCGVSINNKVTKGVDKVSNFSNFIETYNLRTYEEHENYNVLVHTRNASQKNTKSDVDCAHPFEIKTKKGKTILIGVHNGVIYNDDEIAKKYKVKEEKVDSKTILNIIAKARTDDSMYKVLEDYTGAAVLVWFYPDEPNTLYMWKGASKSYSGSTTINEERSLFVYRVKDKKGKFTNQYYISSIKESLLAIGGELDYKETDEDKEPSIRAVETNCIIKIVPGEKIRMRVIKRDSISSSTEGASCNITTYTKTYSSATTTVKKSIQEINREKMLATFVNYPFKKVNACPILDTQAVPIIDNEPFLHDFHSKKNKIYFLRGRYWQNGHMIGGNEKEEVVTREVDIDGYPKDSENCDKDSLDTYYFFQGILLTGQKPAEEVKKLIKSNSVWEDSRKNKLNLSALRPHAYGFIHNFGDTSGSARSSTTTNHWASGDFYPMFDYDRKYTFQTGAFKKAVYEPTNALEKMKMWKGISTENITETKIIPLTKSTETNIAIKEAVSAIDEVKEEKVINHCYDALSSVKAALKELEPFKNDKKFDMIYKMFEGQSKVLTSKLALIEKTKEEDEDFTLTSEIGILYS